MSAKLKTISAALLIFVVSAAGCSSNECAENRNSLPYAGFFSSEETPQSIELDSISIFGIGAPADALLADTARDLGRVYLPFRLEDNTTSFVFRYEQKNAPLPDTVTFDYQSHPYFVSEACGAVYIYDISKITTTHHAIDSVVCPRNIIDNKSGLNINIYFRTQSVEANLKPRN